MSERLAAKLPASLSASLPDSMPVSIRAQVSLADPDSCTFVVSHPVHPGGPFFFGNKQRAAGSPLGERLFALLGVANVLIAENVLTVGKAPSAAWSGLKASIGTAIRTQLLSGVPAILEVHVHSGTQGRSDAALYTVVQELLDKQVNKSIANHGGKISIVETLRGKLFIVMSGGCQGCASSQVTLRQGFDVMLKRVAPESKKLSIPLTTQRANSRSSRAKRCPYEQSTRPRKRRSVCHRRHARRSRHVGQLLADGHAQLRSSGDS